MLPADQAGGTPVESILAVHVTAAGIALVAGFVALYAPKGRAWHRKSGMLFVGSMLVMGLGAAVLGNVLGGLLVVYYVVTAQLALRPPSSTWRRLHVGGMLLALALGAVAVAESVTALAFGDGTLDGSPAAPGVVLGGIALLSGLSDFRVIRSGGLAGTARLRRHLWRMCFALFFSSGSFFLGQADEIPEPLRIGPLLVTLAFLPLATMVYWLWRTRRRTAGAARVVESRVVESRVVELQSGSIGGTRIAAPPAADPVAAEPA
jgi:hypothetical protein